MTFNAAALKILVAKGFDGEDLVALALALETAFPVEKSSAAKRQARYRANKKARGVTDDVTSDATSDVTIPPKENKSNPHHSEPIGSGCADPVKAMFDLGIATLVAAGRSEKEARALIGKWRKAKGEADVLQGLFDCRSKAISDPVPWLEMRFKPARYTSKSGYEYRGSLEAIEREAQKRGDNDTYWQIQVDKKRAAQAA